MDADYDELSGPRMPVPDDWLSGNPLRDLDFVYLDVGTELLQNKYTRLTSVCANSIDDRASWGTYSPEPLRLIVHRHLAFGNSLARLCCAAEVQRCRRSSCCRQRERMSLVAPHCEWTAFRDWVVTAMACQAMFTTAERRRPAYMHLVMAVTLCHRLLADQLVETKELGCNLVDRQGQHSIDLASVSELIYWMLTIQNADGLGSLIDAKWGPQFLPSYLVRESVSRSLETAEVLGLCKNRLWNLVGVMERREMDLPGLLEHARRYPALFKQRGHGNCSPKTCPFNSLDTSRMEQLHKTDDPHECPLVVYPVQLLEASIRRGTGSVWSRFEIMPAVVKPGFRYAAISHVWMDGTGIGIGPQADIGVVNKCLMDFFLRIAERLDCDGIWWDTISLPTDRALRQRCINTMHENYRAAECTILHDSFLLNLSWTDDGSPCVAIVLSSWFTRGWTALELYESRRVKVLFKGPHPNEPLIKDLDDDILAKHPGSSTRAHWIATCIIQRMRRQTASRPENRPIASMRDLLAVLRPRSVCRIDDKMTIAGLLADLPPETGCSECKNLVTAEGEAREHLQEHIKRHTSERILVHLPTISHASLLHGKSTIRESGPFSWAAMAIYDMPVGTSGDLDDANQKSSLSLTIDNLGGATGSWLYRGLSEDDCAEGAITPIRDADATTVSRVAAALQNRQACVLLREGHSSKPWLLAMAVGRGQHVGNGIVEDVIDCRYVGAVKVTWIAESTERTRQPSHYGRSMFRIGCDGNKGVVDVQELLPDIVRGGYRASENPPGGEEGGSWKTKIYTATPLTERLRNELLNEGEGRYEQDPDDYSDCDIPSDEECSSTDSEGRPIPWTSSSGFIY
ncbi:het domain containing protein [Grosmannia clavigera kw1407]|uniref:Het domain containing protein n=1 Tax=Grosmannia clavigera (strain kw1407 / UAMH 11150) TaxID=655863 RepID=F0X7I0_GROCL|nr:het domain containing protein [Grosmannia clavigera kw1407]EFX06528.1 het domain containing protein [Grosmannia clavigera kw1407]